MTGGNQYSQVKKIQFKTQWTGAIDSEWEKPGNWSCGVLPDSNTDVVVTSGSVVLSSNAIVHSLTVSSGVSFVANGGNTLTVIQ